MNKYRQIDLFTLELGNALCQEASLNNILKTITSIREDIFEQYGVVIPSVRVKDNKSLSPFEYVIKISGLETARYELKKDSLLILDLGNVTSKMRGTKTKDPTYGLPQRQMKRAILLFRMRSLSELFFLKKSKRTSLK